MSTVYLHEMRAAMYAKPGLVPIRFIRSALGAAPGVESSNSATTGFGAVLAACIHERTEHMQKRTSASRARMSMDPVRQAYKRRMELIDRVCEICASGGLTSEALEKFAPESRLIESEIRLDKASSSQFDPAAQDRVTVREYISAS